MRNAGHVWYISEAHDGIPFDLKTKDFCAMKAVCALLPPTSGCTTNLSGHSPVQVFIKARASGPSAAAALGPGSQAPKKRATTKGVC
jgi:hypothetical protein